MELPYHLQYFAFQLFGANLYLVEYYYKSFDNNKNYLSLWTTEIGEPFK